MTAILDVAQELLQTRGFNAFSIKDLADRLRIRTSSVHYYFPTKADLCRALVARHRRRVAEALSNIDRQVPNAKTKLQWLASLFQSTIDAGNRMCPFGMLAAECATLDPESQAELRASFDDLETWLTRVLTQARKKGELSFAGKPRNEALFIVSSLEGAILVARTHEDPQRFEAAAGHLLSKLAPTARSAE
jgi:TetR/AcrR family transcriptional regulator, transcriptional repressor for nem operon